MPLRPAIAPASAGFAPGLPRGRAVGRLPRGGTWEGAGRGRFRGRLFLVAAGLGALALAPTGWSRLAAVLGGGAPAPEGGPAAPALAWTPLAGASPSATHPNFALRFDGAERHASGAIREWLSHGSGGGGPFVRLLLVRGADGLGPTPTFFVDATRLAARAGLALGRAGDPRPVETRFGRGERATLDVPRAGERDALRCAALRVPAGADGVSLVALRCAPPRFEAPGTGPVQVEASAGPGEPDALLCVVEGLEPSPALRAPRATAAFDAGAPSPACRHAPPRIAPALPLAAVRPLADAPRDGAVHAGRGASRDPPRRAERGRRSDGRERNPPAERR